MDLAPPNRILGGGQARRRGTDRGVRRATTNADVSHVVKKRPDVRKCFWSW